MKGCHKACIASNFSSTQMGYNSELAACLLKVAISHLPINRFSGFKQQLTISMQDGMSVAKSVCVQQESPQSSLGIQCSTLSHVFIRF